MPELTKKLPTSDFANESVVSFRVPTKDASSIAQEVSRFLAHSGFAAGNIEVLATKSEYVKDEALSPGDVLRLWREEKDWSQGELAKNLTDKTKGGPVYQSRISDFERGVVPITYKMACRLGELFETGYKVFL